MCPCCWCLHALKLLSEQASFDKLVSSRLHQPSSDATLLHQRIESHRISNIALTYHISFVCCLLLVHLPPSCFLVINCNERLMSCKADCLFDTEFAEMTLHADAPILAEHPSGDIGHQEGAHPVISSGSQNLGSDPVSRAQLGSLMSTSSQQGECHGSVTSLHLRFQQICT